VLGFIWSSVERAQTSKGQLQALAQTIAQLLWTLNEEYCSGRLLQVKTSMPLANLRGFVIFTVTVSLPLSSNRCPSHRLLDEISAFVQKEASRPFLGLLFTKDQRIAQIEKYHRRNSTAVISFQVSHDIFTASPIDTSGAQDISVARHSYLAGEE
jgi:hypothetical protein